MTVLFGNFVKMLSALKLDDIAVHEKSFGSCSAKSCTVDPESKKMTSF